MPDGLIKLLTILVAKELGPTLLMIDEIENSMHARMLEFVLDELSSMDVPVLVATHSPIAVDLVPPDRVILVERDPERGTVIERVGDTEGPGKRMEELGISLSDHAFYYRT